MPYIRRVLYALLTIRCDHDLPNQVLWDYDGQFLFINDKANARVAVIDLRDFETKQIIKNPISLSDHGGTVLTADQRRILRLNPVIHQ